MSESILLQDTINRIAEKKHVISDEAIAAKQQFDQVKDHPNLFGDDEEEEALFPAEKINALTQSIDSLTQIFAKSNFDELSLFITRPARVLVINFFIGLLRGLGFAAGLIAVAFLLAYIIDLRAVSATLIQFGDYLSQFTTR